jgi:hypothetical protein
MEENNMTIGFQGRITPELLAQRQVALTSAPAMPKTPSMPTSAETLDKLRQDADKSWGHDLTASTSVERLPEANLRAINKATKQLTTALESVMSAVDPNTVEAFPEEFKRVRGLVELLDFIALPQYEEASMPNNFFQLVDDEVQELNRARRRTSTAKA